MTESTISTKPVTAISTTAASLSFTGAVSFIVLLTALHMIKPELDPSWRFISEYAIGENGWIMQLAFVSLAASYVTLFIAVRSQLRTIPGRIGLALLLVSAAGLIIAAVFTTDPITAGQDAMTIEGKLHSLGGTLGFAMPFAALLVSWGLARNQTWSSARRSLFWSTSLAWIGFLASLFSLGFMLSQSNGAFGPDVPVGWPTRLEMLGYCVWLLTVATHAAQLKSPNPSSPAG